LLYLKIPNKHRGPHKTLSRDTCVFQNIVLAQGLMLRAMFLYFSKLVLSFSMCITTLISAVRQLLNVHQDQNMRTVMKYILQKFAT